MPGGEELDLTKCFAKEFDKISETDNNYRASTLNKRERIFESGTYRVAAEIEKNNRSRPLPRPKPRTRGVLVWRDPKDEDRHVETYTK